MVIGFRKLIFGGVDSSDYGIYITGDAVYNAPERSVEFVSVPGRNGDIALDQGRFENITVTYPAGTFGMTPQEFREAVAGFRNAILSQKGYQRLEDTYHPDEYRMAVYASGLEVDPTQYGTAGEFSLAFNCKPQRWLTSGEAEVSVSDGGTLTNPTLFDASPLLKVTGYGTIEFNDYTIELANDVLGDTSLASAFSMADDFGSSSASVSISKSVNLDGSLFNTGDTISIDDVYLDFYINRSLAVSSSSYSGSGASEGSCSYIWPGTKGAGLQVAFSGLTFTAGTSATKTYTGTLTLTINGSTCVLASTCTVTYTATSGGAHLITFMISVSATSGSVYPVSWAMESTAIMVDSSLSILGNPTYIDCDLGECYLISGTSYVSLNAQVDLGSDLPVLAPGSNTIEYDSTVTGLKIIPRWWRI